MMQMANGKCKTTSIRFSAQSYINLETDKHLFEPYTNCEFREKNVQFERTFDSFA